ncbi:hypothetical protein FQZ97_885750 [compost metagenome]
MAGGMQHLQHPITQIQHIPFVDQPRRRRRLHAVLGVAQRAVRMRLEHLVTDPVRRQGVGPGGVGQYVRFRRMHQALGEFVVAGDMVEMGMAGHRQQGAPGEPGQLLAQADKARTGVDQQVLVAALHVPEVAAVEGPHVGLADQADAVVAVFDFEPLVAADDFHGGPLRWGDADKEQDGSCGGEFIRYADRRSAQSPVGATASPIANEFAPTKNSRK